MASDIEQLQMLLAAANSTLDSNSTDVAVFNVTDLELALGTTVLSNDTDTNATVATTTLANELDNKFETNSGVIIGLILAVILLIAVIRFASYRAIRKRVIRQAQKCGCCLARDKEVESVLSVDFDARSSTLTMNTQVTTTPSTTHSHHRHLDDDDAAARLRKSSVDRTKRHVSTETQTVDDSKPVPRKSSALQLRRLKSRRDLPTLTDHDVASIRDYYGPSSADSGSVARSESNEAINETTFTRHPIAIRTEHHGDELPSTSNSTDTAHQSASASLTLSTPSGSNQTSLTTGSEYAQSSSTLGPHSNETIVSNQQSARRARFTDENEQGAVTSAEPISSPSMMRTTGEQRQRHASQPSILKKPASVDDSSPKFNGMLANGSLPRDLDAVRGRRLESTIYALPHTHSTIVVHNDTAHNITEVEFNG